MDFKNKNAVVTGGSRGIGRAIAMLLGENGANVIITYSSSDRAADDVINYIKSKGSEAYKYKIDQSEINKIPELVDFIKSKFKTVDILINNAGICPFKDFFDIDRDLFEKVWKVNVESHFFITQELAKIMIENNTNGRILFISSISAIVGGKYQSHYTTTKSALNGLMHSLAIILGEHGIMVNSIEPGTILTDINREDLSNTEKRRYMEKRIPLGRLGEPLDIARPALFLVSDENTYVNGSEILVDGGMLVNLQ
ncbi:L-rhamnose 1-dehydrogenase [Picrophilus oshimae]|uniref:L-rhamnose 1-dehydrogenase n=1 Tax=Picrophilus torridus (strain ATCC 700027 / DSM 9790 / JCM 10055 / NBRC 100828 / KAW 2/3) TaxID=1122961 RepID=A0A8G2L7U1_PICTO|nr:L-rhamnose 1-dehydrogenase [Picrophilus oshimae]SMD31468.1 L-rhamnose 1-dehydrogenase [Picrophilus oshimae DSM 9789]